MIRLPALFLLPLLAACTVIAPLTDEVEVYSEAPLEPAKLVAFETSDGLQLAYRAYVPEGEVKAALVFYHGWVAHSSAGYRTLGHRLQRMGIATYMPDVLRYAYAQQERGDMPDPRRVVQDAAAFVNFVHAEHPETALAIGGHSSGAGLTLNVLEAMAQPMPVNGAVMIAPNFAAMPEGERGPNDVAFVDPEFNEFMAIDGWFEHSVAVGFNYPDIVRDRDPRQFDEVAVAMARALTPERPRLILTSLNMPVGIWLGEDDAQLETAKIVQSVLDSNPQAELSVVDDDRNDNVMMSAGEEIGEWILGLDLGQ